jgi:hypothetical protein
MVDFKLFEIKERVESLYIDLEDELIHKQENTVRIIERNRLLSQAIHYKGVKDIKKRNPKLYKKLLRKRVLADCMDRFGWRVPKREVVTVKSWVLKQISYNKKIIKRSPQATFNRRKIIQFVYNHGHHNGLCFDAKFAQKLHDIKMGE